MKNITTTNDKVIVFGKIPARSIRIPLIGGGTYSPDFMYVVKKMDGSKELNIVIETKAYDKESHITLTGDSYITSLENEDTTNSNIDFNGYKLYVNGEAIN